MYQLCRYEKSSLIIDLGKVLVSTLFFILIVLSVYSYVIYPLLLKLFKPLSKLEIQSKEDGCSVTLIVSAYNEAEVIAKKIENSLEIEYPRDQLEVIVVSDGSTDGTDQIVRQYADRNVVLISSEIRRGKTAGLNAALIRANGDIVIFTDADSMFPRDTVKKFVEFFCDESVGLVTGSTSYLSTDGKGVAHSAGIYTRLETFIKYLETLSGSCVGADGAIFAVRKCLYRPLRDDDINDLVIPLNVIRSGKRVVLRKDLVCFEPPSADEKSAFLRQARISNRTLRALFRNLDLLNFLKFRNFSFKIGSHKFIRLCTPFFMLALIPLNYFLLEKGDHFLYLLIAQIVFYGFAIAGSKVDLFKPAYHFVLVQIAVLYGWYLYMKGESIVTWNPRN